MAPAVRIVVHDPVLDVADVYLGDVLMGFYREESGSTTGGYFYRRARVGGGYESASIHVPSRQAAVDALVQGGR